MANTAKNPDIEELLRCWPHRLYRRGPLDHIRIFPRHSTYGRPFTPRHHRLLIKWLANHGVVTIDEHELHRALLRVSLDPLPHRLPSAALLRRRLNMIKRGQNDGR